MLKDNKSIKYLKQIMRRGGSTNTGYLRIWLNIKVFLPHHKKSLLGYVSHLATIGYRATKNHNAPTHK